MDPKNEEFIGLVQAAGWSQAETARRLGVTTSAISQIFNGRTMPSSASLNLLKLAIAKENTNVLRDAGPSMLEPWASDLVAELRRMNPADRDRVLVAIRQLIRAFPVAQVAFTYKVRKQK